MSLAETGQQGRAEAREPMNLRRFGVMRRFQRMGVACLLLGLGLVFLDDGVTAYEPPADLVQEQEHQRMDAQASKEAQAAVNRQQKIGEILQAFNEGRLQLAAARKSLYPLVKAEMEGELQMIDEQLEYAKRHLEFLEKAKKNPDLLVQQRVDMMLGHNPE